VLLRHASELKVHTVLADPTAVLDARRLGDAVSAAGAQLVVADLASDKPGVHDAQKLAAAYTRLLTAD
jgi:hypothetical protein